MFEVKSSSEYAALTPAVKASHPNASFTNPNWKDWSSAGNTPALDKAMVTKLYTGSCGFNAGFRIITP